MKVFNFHLLKNFNNFFNDLIFNFYLIEFLIEFDLILISKKTIIVLFIQKKFCLNLNEFRFKLILILKIF